MHFLNKLRTRRVRGKENQGLQSGIADNCYSSVRRLFSKYFAIDIFFSLYFKPYILCSLEASSIILTSLAYLSLLVMNMNS